MQPHPDPETISVGSDIDTVCCNGGGGALGHPAVYYTFNGHPRVECLYCDRVFVKPET
ncbi:MAG: zinc-finger domain-containing protein [Rhodospirillales bacterium]|nr:zinc-finger domain-containing protein [Rhodospirillales bacterium]